MSEMLTDAEVAHLRDLYAREKILILKKPPWTCPECRQKSVTQFFWDEQDNCLVAFCSCGWVNRMRR